jgi:uncharacterized protein (DUF433 family)
MDLESLITVEPGKRSGQPCVRGMPITVPEGLDCLAGGVTVNERLDDFPERTRDHVRACLAYAAGGEFHMQPGNPAGDGACAPRP